MDDNLASQFLIREDVAFLNHGSFGACPKPVFAAYQAIQLEIERQPVAFLARELTERMHAPRKALAAELGTAPENIAGALANATFGLNIVAQSLDLKEGDEILTSDHEYAALDKTWAFVARRSGAKIVRVTVPLPLISEDAFFDAFAAAITPRTRVLFLSHITSPTALMFPIDRLVAEARNRDIYTVIDGAHAIGQRALDLDALGADFYAGNCHKWLMSPKGAAFLYARPEVQKLINPIVLGHGWTPDSKNADAVGPFGNSPFIDENEFQGTRDSSAWLSIPAVLDFRRQHDWPSIMVHCSDLAWETAQRVSKLTGLPQLADRPFVAPQMIAMPVPRIKNPPAFQQRLMELYGIEIPVLNWGDHSIVRVSIQGYNNKAQADLLVRALKEQFAL
jgi:isopenicillin-N epimerase